MTILTPGTQKVRRDAFEGKRGDGHRRDRWICRPDPARIAVQADDPTLPGVAGLVDFGEFLEKEGVDRKLRQRFWRLKDGKSMVYGMENQLRVLIDAIAAGAGRVFDLEHLAADPLFARLAGGVVSSIDTR